MGFSKKDEIIYDLVFYFMAMLYMIVDIFSILAISTLISQLINFQII